MKKQYFIYTLLLALLVGMTTSCVDRLNIEKHGNMGSMDEYYQTDSEAEAALAAMYISWRNQYYNWWFVKNTLSDDAWAAGGQRGDNTELEQLNEFRFDTSNSLIEGLYSGMYSIIYYANLIIDRVPGTTTVMQRCIAEAKVARAWAHGVLVSLWGTAPIVDHLLEPDEYRQSNGTAADTWAFIERELQEAIDSGALPSKSSLNDQETGIHLTLEAAKAFLGKAYLFQGKYAEAATVLDEVIDSGKYDLYSDYDALFHASANNCHESIFELQVRNDQEQAWNQWSMFYIMIGWRTDKLTLTGNAAATIASGTYGFMNPRKSLYDAFVAEEGEDGEVWIPKNYSGNFKGDVSLRYALAASLNIATVNVLNYVGITNAINYVEPIFKAKHNSDKSKRMFNPDLTLGLGTGLFTPLELTTGFAEFANEGKEVNPILIRYVTDRYGIVIDNFEEELKKEVTLRGGPKQVISKEAAYLISDILMGVLRGGTATSAMYEAGFTRRGAGKTGTSNDWKDAWFVGYTPELATGIWIGFDSFKYSLGNNQVGGRVAAPIWGKYMVEALKEVNKYTSNYKYQKQINISCPCKPNCAR